MMTITTIEGCGDHPPHNPKPLEKPEIVSSAKEPKNLPATPAQWLVSLSLANQRLRARGGLRGFGVSTVELEV